MEFAGNGLIFVTGSPGSGKGTLCKKLAAQYGFRHQSIGDMLRQMIASATANNMIVDYIPRGQVLPPKVLFEVLKTSMGELTGKHPFLLDGFPRQLEQATPVEAEFGSPELVLFFDCPKEIAEERVIARRVGRPGDDRETFRKRYKEFMELNPPILKHYDAQGRLIRIDTSGDVEASYADLVSALRSRCQRMS